MKPELDQPMMPTTTPFAAIAAGDIRELPETAALPRSWHQWSQAEIDALMLAYAAGRPLLVRGEPGTGKTQLARAAADCLGWRLHAETIHPRFEPQELLARFDAVLRLADAQAQVKLDNHRYWRPGVLWKAYGWASAQPFLVEAERLADPAGHVVLIDEIDKADSDLPNSLLEVLAQRSFQVEPVAAPIGGPGVMPPLIVITTNEERELPAAFLRRCIVLSLAPEGDYRDWLVGRGRAHFGALAGVEGREQALLDDAVLDEAADQLVADRAAVSALNLVPPGLAEYLDLLQALHEIFAGENAAKRRSAQLAWLNRLSAYGYLKHAVDDTQHPAHQRSQAALRRAAGSA